MNVTVLTKSKDLKKMAWHEEDVENNIKSDTGRTHHQMQELEKFLRKLQLPMAVFGICFLHKTEAKEEDKFKGKVSPLAKVYNSCVFLCLWMVFVKSILAFFVGEKHSEFRVMRIIVVTWAFEVAVNATIMLKGSHPRYGHANAACAIWKTRVLPVLNELDLDIQVAPIKRHLLRVTIVGWFAITLNVCIMTFSFLFPYTAFYEILPEVIISPFPINNYTKAIALVILIYKTTVWILPILHCAALSIILTYTFKSSRQAVEKVNKDKRDTNIYPGCLFRERNLHLDICKVVETFDKDMKYMYTNLCCTHIALSCFLLYRLYKTHMDTITMVGYEFWLSASLLSLTMTCFYAAKVNKAAHSPLDSLYETGTNGMTLEQAGQVNLFLSKLTAFPIGFTVLDFFVISREFILTVFGIFLTYSVVMLQF